MISSDLCNAIKKMLDKILSDGRFNLRTILQYILLRLDYVITLIKIQTGSTWPQRPKYDAHPASCAINKHFCMTTAIKG